jgi:hypothetical protein
VPSFERSPSKRASADIKSKAEKMSAAQATPLRLCCAMAVVGRVDASVRQEAKLSETCERIDLQSKNGMKPAVEARYDSHDALLYCGEAFLTDVAVLLPIWHDYQLGGFRPKLHKDDSLCARSVRSNPYMLFRMSLQAPLRAAGNPVMHGMQVHASTACCKAAAASKPLDPRFTRRMAMCSTLL